ncbi:activated RNA polymerase II transcriptional coactivator p15-like [Sycon ciliatum]|uniref:activated RNA polymerase II transcriptional coactivator p15-like n=1 Tax=Sycon ciliatum TaxID=27933 RepID=UPI0031F5F8BF
MASKRKSKQFVEDSDSEEFLDDEPKKKVAAKKKTKSENDFFELSGKRRLSISEFRGKLLVDIREFYEADGEMKPGRKGISLSLDQWEKLKTLIPQVDEQLAAKK